MWFERASVAVEWTAVRFIQHPGKQREDFKVVMGCGELQATLGPQGSVRGCGQQTQAFSRVP